jgi:hypothetical protein
VNKHNPQTITATMAVVMVAWTITVEEVIQARMDKKGGRCARLHVPFTDGDS